MYEAMYEAMRLAGFAGWTVHCVRRRQQAQQQAQQQRSSNYL